MITVAYLRTLPGLCAKHLDDLERITGTGPFTAPAAARAYLAGHPERTPDIVRAAMAITVAYNGDRSWIYRVVDVGLRASGFGHLCPCGPDTLRPAYAAAYAAAAADDAAYAAAAADDAAAAAADAAADARAAAWTEIVEIAIAAIEESTP